MCGGILGQKDNGTRSGCWRSQFPASAHALVNVGGTQPVPIALPPVVLVDLVWACRDVGSSFTDLAPHIPLFLGLQLEGACVQQCLLERQEMLIFWSNGAGTQPVPVPFPAAVPVDLFWGRRNAGRSGIAFAPRIPLVLGL